MTRAMNHTSFLPRPPRWLAIALVALGLPAFASAADLRQRLKVRQEASEVVLGETMQSFYQGESFQALSHILLAKSMGRTDQSVSASEMLLGDLYTAFGMPDEADNIFARLDTRSMRSQTRHETQFRQGRLHYRQGKYFDAERVLNEPLDAAMTPLETERRIMLANVLMSRGAFDEAREALAPITLDNPMGPYALYNIGVSHLRANNTPEGKALLEQVMDLPVSDNAAHNALKDRAALALGYGYLQQQQSEEARAVLMNVRLKGPFSNSALLALGWSYFDRNDFRRALAYWLELGTRNRSDASVQEALVLAPRAYEALSANRQALEGYQRASAILSGELQQLARLEQDIGKPGWLDRLHPQPQADVFGDPLAVPDTLVPGDAKTVARLYDLFSDHPFNEGYQQYSQLKRLRAVLDQRSSDLRVMRELATWHRSRQAAMEATGQRVAATAQRLTRVTERFPMLEMRVRQELRAGKAPAASGNNIATMEQQLRLQQIETQLRKQPYSATIADFDERIAILKGLVLMNNAGRAAPTQNEVYTDLIQSGEQLRMLKLRMEAVQQLLADRRQLAARDNDALIRNQEARLKATYQELDRALGESRRYLQQLALNQIEDSRNRINSDIAEAHLNIARLQDVSLTRDRLLPGATQEAPTP